MAQSGDSSRARHAATRVVRKLQNAGFIAYFAGGCVRDELMGLDPTDYDVATDATPDHARKLFRNTREVGVSFAVLHVRIDGITIEVATFRSEGPYSDRRRPDAVQFADPISDARRRDFTVNALFLDPLAAEDAPDIHGHVIDHVGGLEDLRARLLRAVGDPEQRLAEDHLRALRAVRLAAKLGFRIDPPTARAIRAHAGDLVGVSRERIGDELRRMLTHHTRGTAVALLEELGLDEPVLGPTFGPPPESRLLPELDSAPEIPLSLAALALDRGVPLETGAMERAIASWRDLLCLSNEEKSRATAALTGIVRLRDRWWAEPVAARKRAAASHWFEDARTLLRHVDPEAARRLETDLEGLAASPGGLWPAPYLTGDTLISEGFEPGPNMGQILEMVYDAQLEGRIDDRDQALELARKLRV